MHSTFNAIDKVEVLTFTGALSPFSFWYTVPVTVKGMTYSSVGHYLVWYRAITYEGDALAAAIFDAQTVEEVRSHAVHLKRVTPPEWKKVAPNPALEANQAKFTQNPKLLQILLATAGAHIVECNPFDTFWASGMSHQDERLTEAPISTWPGKNISGQLLMSLRETQRAVLSISERSS